MGRPVGTEGAGQGCMHGEYAHAWECEGCMWGLRGLTDGFSTSRPRCSSASGASSRTQQPTKAAPSVCECHTVGQGGKVVRDGRSGPRTDSCSMFMGSSSPHQMWMQVHVTCECTCICTSSRQSCTCLLCEWWVGGCGGDYSTDLEKAEGGRKLSLGVKAREQVVGDVEEHQGR